MTQVLSGTVQAPASKSITHRAYILAAQSDVPCNVARPLRAADTDATLAGLHRLGHTLRPGDRAVEFRPAPAAPPREAVDCRNAGTGLRLLTAAAARHPFSVAFTGDTSLSGRPNGPLLDALRTLGVRVQGGPTLPYAVHGPLRPGEVRMEGGISSQFASALLLSLPLLDGPSTLRLAAPVHSAPYLDVTRQVATAFGLRIEDDDGGPAAPAAGTPGEPDEAEDPRRNGTGHGGRDAARVFHIPGGQRPRASVVRVEGDWSAAAFPLVGAAITGGRVTVEGVGATSAQGDRAILAHLESFGAHVRSGERSVTVEGRDLESPGAVDVGATPDLFPVLAVLAACAKGTTRFHGGDQLRHKESDRIRAMAEALERLGMDVQERPDGLTVHGGRPLRAASLHAHHDHRIHMALRLAALVAPGPVDVDGAETAAVSYPQFHEDLARLTEASP